MVKFSQLIYYYFINGTRHEIKIIYKILFCELKPIGKE